MWVWVGWSEEWGVWPPCSMLYLWLYQNTIEDTLYYYS